jgi:hypothetical protein
LKLVLDTKPIVSPYLLNFDGFILYSLSIACQGTLALMAILVISHRIALNKGDVVNPGMEW